MNLKHVVIDRIQFDRGRSYVKLACGHWCLVALARGADTPLTIECTRGCP